MSGLLVAAACVPLIAGCGGDSAKPLSRAQYVKRANAICARGTAQLRAARQTQLHVKPSAGKTLAFFRSVVFPNIGRQLNAIKALPKPKGDEAALTKMLATGQDDLAGVKAVPASFTTPRAFAAFNRLANAYGLTACGS